MKPTVGVLLIRQKSSMNSWGVAIPAALARNPKTHAPATPAIASSYCSTVTWKAPWP